MGRHRLIELLLGFAIVVPAHLQLGVVIMSSATSTERRATPRQRLGRLATMLVGGGAPPRYCLVTDFSDGGIRVNSNGFKIPEKFELRFSGDGRFKDGQYEVIWRNDPIVGARFVGPSPNT